jgi:hypothetical protein
LFPGESVAGAVLDVDGLGLARPREHLDVGLAVLARDAAAGEDGVGLAMEVEERLADLRGTGRVADVDEDDAADDGPGPRRAGEFRVGPPALAEAVRKAPLADREVGLDDTLDRGFRGCGRHWERDERLVV